MHGVYVCLFGYLATPYHLARLFGKYVAATLVKRPLYFETEATSQVATHVSRRLAGLT